MVAADVNGHGHHAQVKDELAKPREPRVVVEGEDQRDQRRGKILRDDREVVDSKEDVAESVLRCRRDATVIRCSGAVGVSPGAAGALRCEFVKFGGSAQGDLARLRGDTDARCSEPKEWRAAYYL